MKYLVVLYALISPALVFAQKALPTREYQFLMALDCENNMIQSLPIEFSPDGKYFLFCSTEFQPGQSGHFEQSIKLYNAASGMEVLVIADSRLYDRSGNRAYLLIGNDPGLGVRAKFLDKDNFVYHIVEIEEYTERKETKERAVWKYYKYNIATRVKTEITADVFRNAYYGQTTKPYSVTFDKTNRTYTVKKGSQTLFTEPYSLEITVEYSSGKGQPVTGTFINDEEFLWQWKDPDGILHLSKENVVTKAVKLLHTFPPNTAPLSGIVGKYFFRSIYGVETIEILNWVDFTKITEIPGNYLTDLRIVNDQLATLKRPQFRDHGYAYCTINFFKLTDK